MANYDLSRARYYFEEIKKLAQSRSPGLISNQPSDPLVILAEAFSSVAAMIDFQMSTLPYAIASELPGLFGLSAQFARPATGHIQVEPHPKSKESLVTIPKETAFQILDKQTGQEVPYRLLEPLEVFKAGEIFLKISPESLTFGIENCPPSQNLGAAVLSLFFDLEVLGLNPWSSLSWSYHDGTDWKPLSARDGTLGFFRSGIVSLYLTNLKLNPTILENQKAYWFRVNFDPRKQLVPIRRILNNVGKIENSVFHEKITLGSSNGHPQQKIELPMGQLAGPLSLSIQSKDGRSLDPWKEVDSFFLSDSKSKDFIYDHALHQIVFGDGHKGAIPAPGFDNLVLTDLLLTQGSGGNIEEAGEISFEDSSQFGKIKLVTNCQGGTESKARRELINQLHTSLLNRDRAITIQDFEDLTLKACPRIGRAFVRQEPNALVRIIPVLMGEYSPDPQALELAPLPEDLHMIEKYLDMRRVLNSRIIVEKPDYLDLHIHVQVLVTTEPHRVQLEIEEAIRTYFSPLHPEGIDIRPGNSYSVEHLQSFLERIPNIYVFRSLKIENISIGTCLPITALKPNQLPRIKIFVRAEEMRAPQ
jgi:hypothetical protein